MADGAWPTAPASGRIGSPQGKPFADHIVESGSSVLKATVFSALLLRRMVMDAGKRGAPPFTPGEEGLLERLAALVDPGAAQALRSRFAARAEKIQAEGLTSFVQLERPLDRYQFQFVQRNAESAVNERPKESRIELHRIAASLFGEDASTHEDPPTSVLVSAGILKG